VRFPVCSPALEPLAVPQPMYPPIPLSPLRAILSSSTASRSVINVDRQVHCFCTASQFLATVAPCIFANCSTADQNATETAAQKICNAANPPVQLPSFGSLLNASSTSTASHASSTASAASSVGAGVPTAAASSATSASGRIEGNMRVMMAIAAMVGIIAVAFFAV